MFFKRTLPVLIAFAIGLLMLVQYFIPHQWFENLLGEINRWLMIVAAFALVIGLASLLHMHVTKVRRRVAGWGYSVITLVALVVYTVIGFACAGDYSPSTAFGWGFNYLYLPLGATMFSLLAFFIASAAYRAFRARTLEAGILLVVAVIVMLERIPLGQMISKAIPALAQWIMLYPNMAAKRAIFIGVALGVVSTSLRIISGIERSYLGGGD